VGCAPRHNQNSYTQKNRYEEKINLAPADSYTLLRLIAVRSCAGQRGGGGCCLVIQQYRLSLAARLILSPNSHLLTLQMSISSFPLCRKTLYSIFPTATLMSLPLLPSPFWLLLPLSRSRHQFVISASLVPGLERPPRKHSIPTGVHLAALVPPHF